MPELSKFQSLPLLVVDSIVQKLVNDKRTCFIFSPRYSTECAALAKAASKQWKILYNVSRYWRDLALRFFCKRATVRLVYGIFDYLEIAFDNRPLELYVPSDTQHFSYVKNVIIHLGGISDHLSRTFAVFADSWPGTIVFPDASKITMVMETRKELDYLRSSTISESDRTALQRITGKVLKALPKFSRATIEIRGHEAKYTHYITREVFAEHGLHKILTSIFTGSDIWDPNIRSATFIKEYPYLVSETSLTSLYFLFPHMIKEAVDVIVRNAPILVTLVLDVFPMSLLEDIMLDKEKNPIVYPRLKTFEYYIMSNLRRDRYPKDVKGVPFPSLERVKCQAMYVFKDDALFRGCSESLKHLDMRIDIPAINMLTEYGVVEKLRNLRSINIKFGYSSHGYGDKSTRPLQFAFELVSQSTRSLVLRDFLDDYSIAETIAQYPNMQSLVHLNLSSVKLKLTEVIEVIKILPNLEYFRYTCNGLGSVPGRLQSKNIPRHVLKKYYPLSLRLKYCDINTFANKPTKSLAITAMLLALLCPRFTFAKVPDEVLAAYNSTIENSICDEPYLEFSDRLQCLLR